MTVPPILVLGSGSARRVDLLAQAGIEPDRLLPAHIDESRARAEHPRSLARRLSREKADRVREILQSQEPEDGAGSGKDANAFILSADTVVAVGRSVMPKAELLDEASQCLRMLSGRMHKVYTGVALIAPSGKVRQRVTETRVRFKRLSRDEMESYLASGEWRGKAGGYAIQGLAGTFVIKLVGSYSNVVGLPLAETVSLMVGEGYPVHANWLAGGV